MNRAVVVAAMVALTGGAAPAALAESARTAPVERGIGGFEGQTLGDERRAQSRPEDREALTLTLFQQGPAQVAERRQVGLRSGAQLLRIHGVPAELDAETLVVSGEGSPAVRRSRVRAAGLSPAALLEAHVGREVTLVRETAEGDTRERRVRLLSAADGLVVEGEHGIEALNPDGPWRPVFAAVPDHLTASPVLELDLETDLAGRQQLDLGYLTGGLDWRVGYVITLGADADTMALGAWATLRNRTETAFRDAAVRLVAGAAAEQARPQALTSRALDAEVGEPEAVAEQYRFRLERPVSLEPGDEQQVRFLSADDIPVSREYRTRGGIGHGRQARGTFQPVTVHLTFANEEPGLGRPLPGGNVRVYQLDSDGEPVLAGEDRLRPTPTGEEAELTTGAAFDLTAQRRQTAYRRLDDRTEEQAWEVRVRNAGDVDRDVVVEESLPGEWTMLEESAEHSRPDAGRARWTLPVPAGESATLTFRAEIRR